MNQFDDPGNLKVDGMLKGRLESQDVNIKHFGLPRGTRD